MEVLVAAAGDHRAHLACHRTHHGAGTMIRMRPKVEVMAAAHLHHNADLKVDVWVCQADRACVEHLLVVCSTA